MQQKVNAQFRAENEIPGKQTRVGVGKSNLIKSVSGGEQTEQQNPCSALFTSIKATTSGQKLIFIGGFFIVSDK